MPDRTISVLSTRPLPALLIDVAAKEGITIDGIPFIRTEEVEDEGLRQQVRELAKRPLVAVFTSTNAVEAVIGWIGTAKEWTIFCTGGATRQLVDRYFCEAPAAVTGETAKALAEKIIGWGGTKELFFFCGDLRREELPRALQEAGIRVDELVVYRTTPTPRTVEGSYEGVIFFSPSAVESFFSANRIPAETPLFAIGSTTAATIQRSCSNPVIISEQPDVVILIRQVIEYYQIKNRQQ
jgi:uroporphyrinogen-III synthase